MLSYTSVRAKVFKHMGGGGTKLGGCVHNVGMSAEKTLRRVKTYAGTQGYVYQYYFVGRRAALADDPEAPATEFVFDVTSDRKLTYAVSVFLPEKSVNAWSSVHGRLLTDAEQYAAAKLRLFRAFDELEDVKAKGRRLVIDEGVLEETLAGLGVE
ncbi:MAG: hypothetical protein WBX08_16640 [Candidatus Sulfotelmatobacter sp.]